MEDDRVAIIEAQLAQAKQIADEADRKYEEVKFGSSASVSAKSHRLRKRAKTFLNSPFLVSIELDCLNLKENSKMFLSILFFATLFFPSFLLVPGKPLSQLFREL